MTERPDQPIDVKDLYERYGRAVYRRCQSFLRNDEEARDAFHDVFIKILERHAEFRGASAPFTWVIAITTHHCLNVLRSRRAAWRARYEQDVKVEVAAQSASRELTRLEREQLLGRVLARADADSQAAAVFYFVEELSQEDAAVAAGCSVPTLRKRLRAFIKTARHVLKLDDPEQVFGRPPV